MDGHRNPSDDGATPNVDQSSEDGTGPASPVTPVQANAGGQLFSAISSIFSSHSDATPRQSVATEASDALETGSLPPPPPPPSAFRSPVRQKQRSSDVSADQTEEFISADEGHRSSSPVSDEDSDGFESDPDPTLHEGVPPRAPRTQHARPPSSSAFGTPQSVKAAIFGHERTSSELSSSTSGDLDDDDGQEADRSLTNSTSSDSVRTAVKKKSIGGIVDEDELVMPSLAKTARTLDNKAVQLEQ